MTVLVPSMIEITDDGKARIAGTGFKVRVLAEIARDRGLSAQEIADEYEQLTVAQVHAGLSYYYEHKAEFDAEIARLEQIAKEYWEAHPESVLDRSALERRLLERSLAQ